MDYARRLKPLQPPSFSTHTAQVPSTPATICFRSRSTPTRYPVPKHWCIPVLQCILPLSHCIVLSHRLRYYFSYTFSFESPEYNVYTSPCFHTSAKHAMPFGAFVCLAMHLIIAVASNEYQYHVNSQRLSEWKSNEILPQSSGTFTPDFNHDAQLAYRMRHDLKVLLQQSLHVWEFARFAERIALFMQLIEAQIFDIEFDEGPFLALLISYFP